jgi:hypothetical protein
MEGEYDSYGQVFIDGTKEDGREDLRESVVWDCPELRQLALEEDPEDDLEDLWGTVCDLMSKGAGHEAYILPPLTERPNLAGLDEAQLKQETEKWLSFLKDRETKGSWGWIPGYEPKPGNGIAAIHSRCYKTDPAIQSERDPNQGWGAFNPAHLPNPTDEDFLNWHKDKFLDYVEKLEKAGRYTEGTYEEARDFLDGY